MSVINVKDAPNGWTTNPNFVYIGRAGHGFEGTFGNPFMLGRDGQRDLVIAKYEQYIRARVLRDPDFRLKVKSLKGKTLCCFCAPLKCHGEVLEQVALEISKEESDVSQSS